MKESALKPIVDYVLAKITREEFYKMFPYDILNNPDLYLELLREAFQERNDGHIECLITLGFKLDIYDHSHVDLLCQLLDVDWHCKHEDIARLLQDLKDPRAIEVLYRTALRKYKYLEYNNSSALGIKCVWALFVINTPESIEKLKLISQSDTVDIEVAKRAKKKLGEVINKK